MKILKLLIALKHSFKGFKGQKALFKPFDVFLMQLSDTVGSETVAMFGGFGLGGVWRLGVWESRLALGGPYKVFHLGFQMVFRSYDLNQWL